MGITSASGVRRSSDVIRWCFPSFAVRCSSAAVCPDASSACRLAGIPPLVMTTAAFSVSPTNSNGIPGSLMLMPAKRSRSAYETPRTAILTSKSVP
jgi:hypothetical protein